MPALEQTDRHQAAVYWAKAGQDGYNEPLLSAPVELKVRWLNRKSQMVGPEGTPITVDATVVLGQEVELGSELWLGTLENYYGIGSSGSDTEHMRVVAYRETTDLKHRHTRRVAGLAYSRDTRSEQA